VTTEGRLAELVRVSREVGEPALDLVVLAEGNTSTLLDDRTFFVKEAERALRASRRRTSLMFGSTHFWKPAGRSAV